VPAGYPHVPLVSKWGKYWTILKIGGGQERIYV
jgi:hypothetical protein